MTGFKPSKSKEETPEEVAAREKEEKENAEQAQQQIEAGGVPTEGAEDIIATTTSDELTDEQKAEIEAEQARKRKEREKELGKAAADQEAAADALKDLKDKGSLSDKDLANLFKLGVIDQNLYDSVYGLAALSNDILERNPKARLDATNYMTQQTMSTSKGQRIAKELDAIQKERAKLVAKIGKSTNKLYEEVYNNIKDKSTTLKGSKAEEPEKFKVDDSKLGKKDKNDGKKSKIATVGTFMLGVVAAGRTKIADTIKNAMDKHEKDKELGKTASPDEVAEKAADLNEPNEELTQAHNGFVGLMVTVKDKVAGIAGKIKSKFIDKDGNDVDKTITSEDEIDESVEMTSEYDDDPNDEDVDDIDIDMGDEIIATTGETVELTPEEIKYGMTVEDKLNGVTIEGIKKEKDELRAEMDAKSEQENAENSKNAEAERAAHIDDLNAVSDSYRPASEQAPRIPVEEPHEKPEDVKRANAPAVKAEQDEIANTQIESVMADRTKELQDRQDDLNARRAINNMEKISEETVAQTNANLEKLQMLAAKTGVDPAAVDGMNGPDIV